MTLGAAEHAFGPQALCAFVTAGRGQTNAGEFWHGSDGNKSEDRMHRSTGVHMVPIEATFSDRDGGYVYRCYN